MIAEKLHTVKEVATELRVSPRTVLRWCKAGKIKPYYSLTAKVIVIPADAVKRLLSTHKQADNA